MQFSKYFKKLEIKPQKITLVDVEQRLLLLTSMGQLKQLRVWVKSLDHPIPPNIDLNVVRSDDRIMLVLTNLDVNLYSKLTTFIEFLKSTKLIALPNLEFEADLDSYAEQYDFSVLLNPKGELILLNTSHANKQGVMDKLMIEWTKRIAKFLNDD